MVREALCGASERSLHLGVVQFTQSISGDAFRVKLGIYQLDIAAAGWQLWASQHTDGISKKFLLLEFSLGRKVAVCGHCFQQALLEDSWSKREQRACAGL